LLGDIPQMLDELCIQLNALVFFLQTATRILHFSINKWGLATYCIFLVHEHARNVAQVFFATCRKFYRFSGNFAKWCRIFEKSTYTDKYLFGIPL
jgi:hypothetical protein